MEKVKLPKEICEVLDSYEFSYDKNLFIWSAMQTKNINERHSLYLVRKYIDDNLNNVAVDIVKAILYGYEPEETEEEREKREFKEKKINSLRNYLQGRIYYPHNLQKYAEDIYELFNKTM